MLSILKNTLLIGLASFCFLALPTLAETFTIPEIQTRVSDQYIIESIAKLDDFLEEIRKKEELKEGEIVGFSSASLVHLGTLTGALVDHFFVKQKIVAPILSSLGNISSVGKVGSLPSRLWGFARGWMLTATAVQAVKTAPPRTFVVHKEDLPLFRQILSQVRDQQIFLVIRFWRKDFKKKDQIANLEKIILETRPTFKKIYEPCSQDPNQYQTDTLVHIFRYSLFDYIKFITWAPSLITAQYNAGFISPTARQYINQFALPFALNKCFKIDPNQETKSQDLGIFGTWFSPDKNTGFVAKVLAADALARGTIVGIIYAFLKFKYAQPAGKAVTANSLGSIKVVDKLLASRIGTVVIQPAINFFNKISPATIARLTLTVTVATSAYALYTVKKEYEELNGSGVARRSKNEFNFEAKKLFHERALSQLEILRAALVKADNETDREMVETEITNWELIAAEFKS